MNRIRKGRSVCTCVCSGFVYTCLKCCVCVFALQCSVEDLERNTGHDDKPYFMSKNLMKLLDAKNVKALDYPDGVAGEEVRMETIQS